MTSKYRIGMNGTTLTFLFTILKLTILDSQKGKCTNHIVFQCITLSSKQTRKALFF